MTTPIRPVISGLCTLKEATLARLACSSAPAVRDFFDRLILLAPIHSSRQFSSESNGMPVMLRSWQTLLTRLIGSWDPAQKRRLTLVRTARTLLAEFGKEADGLGEGRLSKQALKLAAKFAQGLHVWTADLADEIGDRIMRTAIGITRRLIRESEATVNACVSADQVANIDVEEEADMLAKLPQGRAIPQRQLQRSYDEIYKGELEPILDHLIRKGQARRRDDGLIEAVQP